MMTWNPWEIALGRNKPPEAKPKKSAEELRHWKLSVRARIAWRKRKTRERARAYAATHKVTQVQYNEMRSELAKNKTYAAILREAETRRLHLYKLIA